MPLILENVLIRKKYDSLPAGSSGYVVRVPSVFLFMLSEGTEIRGVFKKGNKEQELMLILEKGTCDDVLHIAAGHWDDTFAEGRAVLRLTEAFHNGKKMLLYEQREIITSPAHSCKISPKP
jgi:hypothetical protein